MVPRNDLTLVFEGTCRELECFCQEDLKHRRPSAVLRLEFHIASFIDAVQKLCKDSQPDEEVLYVITRLRKNSQLHEPCLS